MNKSLIALTLGALLSLTACDNADSSTASAKQNVEKEEINSQSKGSEVSAEQAYLGLVDQFFKDNLALEPMYATFVGVNDYNHKFADNLSDGYLEARHQLNKGYLDKLNAIDRSQLSEPLKLSFDMFVYDRNQALVNEVFPERLMPLNQFSSTLITMVQLGSGESAQPFSTVKDYQNWLERMDGFIAWLDQAKTQMDEGIKSKVVLPRILVERMIPQFEAHIVENPEQSLFYTPIKQLPEGFTPEQKKQITQDYKEMIAKRLMPKLASFKSYLTETYLVNARASDGWWGLPNGKAWYQNLSNMHTTTDMPVEEIHQIGLKEVARILSEMDSVRQKVGFKGDLKSFFHSLSTEPEYVFEEREQLIAAYMDLKTKINKVLPEYFDVKPKADYVVKPVESFREQSAAGASYEAPAVDGSRPGVFYINTFNLRAQPKWGLTTLSLHEASPGHHFQIAIKQELTGVPEFQRFSGYTAFEEGWALYAEYLGIEMGLFEDPYQYFGKLSDEMLRAMRLVVDTGLHAKGWSREQAIQYMKDNSPLAESDIIAEVERYMAIPGQALSYKVGQLKILELRANAEQALGDKFDLKAFHSQIITSGSLPMAVMEQKINAWVESLKS